MTLDSYIQLARKNGASDLHLEPGLPVVLRVRGQLQPVSDPVSGDELLQAAKELLGGGLWSEFMERGSFDLGRALGGVRCRINVFRTMRGVSFAIRLLAHFQASIQRLNLHPDFKRLVQAKHGLVVVSGPTGSGKSSTLAAMIEEVNRTERRNVLTIESPIEFTFASKLAFIRQREVGRDTPSFDQALRDALREDSDLLVVGEVRDPESMRLTLAAAETGHLVLTTLHSSNVGDALARMVASFPAETQPGICAQLADALVGVICQRMRFWPGRDACAPECEVLLGTTQARATVRQGHFFKLASVLETGGHEGCWTFARYREWMEQRKDWFSAGALPGEFTAEEPPSEGLDLVTAREPSRQPSKTPPRPPSPAPRERKPPEPTEEGVFAIDDADENLDGILSELDRPKRR